MIIKTKYSKNFTKKTRKNKDIKSIVIHYTGMQSEIASINRLLDSRHKVSCHFLINRKGQIFKMVDENKTAWHAGKSKWKNMINLNENSIGVELVNRGHEFGYQKFTNKQINTLIRLCLNLRKKYKITNSNIVGHSDIAPLRKKDPGEKFPWKRLYKKGLGIWYKNIKSRQRKFNEKEIRKLFFKNIFKIGYRYISDKSSSKRDFFLIKAFQRRFLPKKVTGRIDQKTLEISHFLARRTKI